MYTKLLVEATLGRPVQVKGAEGPVTITREQLAGKIYGLDFVTKLMEDILARGGRAVQELRLQGVNIADGINSPSTN